MVARHPQRPHFRDYCDALIEDFTPLAGDRKFGEDEAIVGGFGRFRGQPVCVHRPGEGLRHRDAACGTISAWRMPEGYRKAVRLMELADRFDLPVLSFVDTAGAYPGIGAEERGQAEAIARSTECLPVARRRPTSRVVIGEGGSGGAVAIASRQHGADARARDLHGGLARRRRPRSCGAIRPGAGRGHEHEDHGAGSAALRRDRRHRRRSRPAARIAIPRRRSPRPATPSRRRLADLAGLATRRGPRPAGREVPRHRPQGSEMPAAPLALRPIVARGTVATGRRVNVNLLG